MTQGVNEPMSVLGMDIWKKLIYLTKTGLLSTCVGGTAPVLNGREYLNVNAYQKVLGKKKVARRPLIPMIIISKGSLTR